MSPDPQSGGPVAAVASRDDLLRLRREVATERARVARRQNERRKLDQLRQRAAEDPASNETSARLIAALQRKLDDAVLMDGDDVALTTQLASAEAALNACESLIAASQAQDRAKSDAVSPAGGRNQQRLLERVREEFAACAMEIESLRAAARAAGVALDAPAGGNPSDDWSVRLADFQGELHSLNLAIAKRSRALQVRRIAGEQAALHLEREAPRAPDAAVDALQRHLKEEFDRNLLQLDRHFATQWPLVHAQVDRLVIQRLHRTQAVPEIDKAFETVSFRPADLALLSDTVRLHLWPLLETAAQALPRLLPLALEGARQAPLEVADLETRGELVFSPMPPGATRTSLSQAASMTDVPALGRVEVPPGKRIRRGEWLAAIGRFLQQVSRMPMVVLGPLAGLSFLGVSAASEAKNYLPVGVSVLMLSAFIAPVMFKRKAWRDEQTLLERGRAQLRENLRKRGMDALQAWRRAAGDHVDAVIARVLVQVREAAAQNYQREANRVERARQRTQAAARDLEALQRRLDAVQDDARKLLQRRLAECERTARSLDGSGDRA